MNRKAILAVGFMAIGVIAIGYGYVQWSERKQAELAAKLEIEQRKLAIERRKAELLRQDRLVAEARDWLDEWPEKPEALTKAAANLQEVIRRNAKHANARIEMARLHLKAGYIRNRTYQPGVLKKAQQELQLVLFENSKSADALILLGHIYYQRGQFPAALKLYGQVEQIGTENPWLHLNWADALIELERLDEADKRLKKAQAQLMAMKDPPRGPMRAMLEKTSTVAQKQGRLDDADKAYRELIAFDPGRAWVHGNYAAFLLFERDSPDAAIAEAEKALAIMDYGIGRLTLAAALYAKWAEVKRKDPPQAAQYLERARSISTAFDWIMPLSAMSVSAGPVMLNAVKELMALGVPLDTRDTNEDTGLTLAAHSGDAKSVEILIKLGANIEAKDNTGRTALANAASKGHLEAVKKLAAYKARFDALDKLGRTPLQIAIMGHHEDMVRLMISLRGDVNSLKGGVRH